MLVTLSLGCAQAPAGACLFFLLPHLIFVLQFASTEISYSPSWVLFSSSKNSKAGSAWSHLRAGFLSSSKL